MKKLKTWWHQAQPVRVKGYTEDTAKGEIEGALRLLEQAARQLYDTHRALMALPGHRRVRADKSDESNSLAWSLSGACSTTYYDLFGEHIPALRDDLRDTEASVARRTRELRASRRRQERGDARKARDRGKLKTSLLGLASASDALSAELRRVLPRKVA